MENGSGHSLNIEQILKEGLDYTIKKNQEDDIRLRKKPHILIILLIIKGLDQRETIK